MSPSLIIQSVVVLAAVFLLVRGVQFLQQNLSLLARSKQLPVELMSLAYGLPLVVFSYLAAARLGTVEIVLPTIIGWNLLAYGVVCAYIVMGQSVAISTSVPRSLAVQLVLTYAFLMMALFDGSIDRFEAVMLVLVAVLVWFERDSSAHPPVVALAPAQVPVGRLIFFILMGLLAIYIGVQYLFTGLMFFSTTYTVSLLFFGFTIAAFLLVSPLILASISLVRAGAALPAFVTVIRTTLIATLLSCGAATAQTTLSSTSPVIDTGLWYVMVFVGVIALSLLVPVLSRRSGLLVFLLFLFCIVKLVIQI